MNPTDFVDNLIGIYIRVSGTGKVSNEIDLFCVGAPDAVQTFKGFGLFTVQIPSGATGCAFFVSGTGAGPGTFIVQVYVQTSGTTPAPPAPTNPTPTPPGSSSDPSGTYRGTWSGTFASSDGCRNVSAQGAATFVVAIRANDRTKADWTQTLTNFGFQLSAHTTIGPPCVPGFTYDLGGAGNVYYSNSAGAWSTNGSTDPEQLTVKNGVLTGQIVESGGTGRTGTVTIHAVRG